MSCETEVEAKAKFEVLNPFDLQWLRSIRKSGETSAPASIFAAWGSLGTPKLVRSRLELRLAGVLAVSWALLGRVEARLEASWARLGASWTHLGCVLAVS